MYVHKVAVVIDLMFSLIICLKSCCHKIALPTCKYYIICCIAIDLK